MKKTISIILAITMMFSIAFSNPFLMDVVAADSGTTGQCTWNKNGTVLTISGDGAMANYSNYNAPWGKTITKVIIEKGVTNIGAHAFRGCSGLTSVTIPESMQSIDEAAFYECSSLTSVTIPESVTSICAYAFWGCSGLTSITIPESVKSIGKYAFSRCSGLTSITIPEGVQSIDESTFSWCSGLTSITIPESVKSIGLSAFLGCSGLTSITIPEGVQSIGALAFSECSGLINITIPNSVTSIGNRVLEGCDKLEKIKLPFINEHIGWLWGSISGENGSSLLPASLKEVEIGASKRRIGESAFKGCVGLTNIIIQKGVTSIGKSAFEGCVGLTNVTMPESVTIIGEYAFRGCSSLKNIILPENMQSIGKYAFFGCSALTNIRIPNGITRIESWTFAWCSRITSIFLPKSVTHFEESPCGTVSFDAEIWYEGSYDEAIEISYDGSRYGPGELSPYQQTWHYNTCSAEHVYKKCDDMTCQSCEWIREAGSCSYTLNMELTCDVCGHSKKPSKPERESQYSGTVKLIYKEGLEYSKDGEMWQSSNVFSGLAGNVTYTFYQRVKATSTVQVSEASEGLSVYLKATHNKPSVPSVVSYTEQMVTLVPLAGIEYSLDGVTWQQNNVFENLSSGTKYTFYQRYAETGTHEASASSSGTSVTTDKSKQTLIPNAPVVQSVSAGSITLVPVEGCEYSKNGATWQSSNVFSNLSCGTEYTFYQRYKNTEIKYHINNQKDSNQNRCKIFFHISDFAFLYLKSIIRKEGSKRKESRFRNKHSAVFIQNKRHNIESSMEQNRCKKAGNFILFKNCVIFCSN